MEENIIPQAVVKEAGSLIKMYGENIVRIGQKGIFDIFMFKFPEDTLTGYPFVYLYDREDKTADTITGFDALDIIGEFFKEK